MKLSSVMQQFILHWGEMGARWGVNRTVAQIQALLYLSDRPLRADEITETLNIARSNVSTSLKELQNWNLVKVIHELGDRRDYFESIADVWQIFMAIMLERKRRELDPTLNILRDCQKQSLDSKDTSDLAKGRIEEMCNFVSMMSGYIDDMQRLSPDTIKHMVRMGSKIQKVLPSKKKR